jgi:hypothetical protein
MTRFGRIDSFIDVGFPDRKSLCPSKACASRFSEIEKSLTDISLTEADLDLLCDSVERIIRTVVVHFPENIFWDFDFMIYRLAYNAKNNEYAFRDSLAVFTEKLVNIFSIFGANSPIKFRYIHDMIYGFDWLKWMLEKKEPKEDMDPYGMDFLNYIHARGLELIALIDKNDTDYPELDGNYRNPFLFSRSTSEEILLHKNLSDSSLLPIEAWNKDFMPKCDKNYSLIRLQRSKEMGISKNVMPGSHKI